MEVRRQVGAQVAGVIAGAIDKARFAASQERHPHQVHPRRIDDDSPVMADTTFAVEHGHIEPGKVRAKPRRPEDGPDLATAQVDAERRRRLDTGGLEAMGRLDLIVQSVFAGPFVDGVEQPVHLEVRQGALVPQ